MARTLIVAEKPSVAREIAKVLGVRAPRQNGYIGDDNYVVSWAIGHLVNIAEPEEQDAAWGGRWSMNHLPMIPAKFKLDVLPGTLQQFNIVKHLMLAEDVEAVINATDAGREGELIFRRIYIKAGCTKPLSRLWANDMTEKGLKKALANTLDGEEKRNLGLAAFARAEADWLIGMNYSRLFTLKDGNLITVGRVQTPVLRLLVDRRREIENFTSKDYWTIEADMTHGEGEEQTSFTAIWHAPPEFNETRIDSEAEAAVVAEACTGKDGAVESVKSSKRQQKPPLPFDLTTLQREANSRFGLSAKDTLAVAQALYEQKKLLTYPRTDSRYFTKELFDEFLDHLRAVYHLFPEAAAVAAQRIKDGKAKFTCVNNKKVSDHHAIIPTTTKANRDALSENEWNIYEMVCRRTIAAFMPPAKYSATTLWALVAEHKFKATGKVFNDLGWLIAEPWRTAKDNPLPKLRKGSKVCVAQLHNKKHKTKPPAHFTDATLLGAMETAGKFVEDEQLRDAMKERGLGTPATRAQTIETLISRGYVEKEKKKLIASDKGLHAIDLVGSFLPDVVSPEMTGDWEKQLGDIEQGRYTYPEFMLAIKKTVHKNVHAIRNHRAYDRDGFPTAPPSQRPAPQPPRRQYDRDGFPIDASQTQPSRPKPAPKPAPKPVSKDPVSEDSLGPCPTCKTDVLEYEDRYACKAPDCPFAIKKELFGGTILPDRTRDLLTKGRTYRRTKFISKKGKPYNANLRLTDTKVEISFED